MSYYGSWKIDDNLTFTVNTHLASSGAATDADAVPAFRVYEDETAAAILTGTMALLDGGTTVGFYSEQIALTAANGFEKGKSYNIYISAAVSGVTGTISHNFQIEAEVDANVVSASNVSANVEQWNGAAVAVPTVAGVPEVDLTHMEGVTQSVTDLKDFADEGYDPATNKVQGVVLVDTTTANSDMRGTNSAALAADYTAARAGYLDNLNIGENVAATSEIAALNDLSAAQVNTEVDTALVDANLDHLVGTAAGIPAIPAGTYLDQIMDDGVAVFDRSTDSLQAIRDQGDMAWITGVPADIADAVWDEAKAGHVGVGSFGEEVQSHATQAEILNDATPFAGGNIDASISSRSDFDETTDPVELLDGGGGAGTSAAELVDDVWDEAIAGHVGVGSFGAEVQSHATQAEILSDAIPFPGANIDALLSDIETDTADIQSRLPAALVAGRIDSSIGAMAANVITAAAIAASGANEIADTTLQRDIDQVEVGAPVHSLITAILKAVARTEDDGAGNLDIYRTDAVTLHATQVISTDPTADPIDGLGVAT